MVKASSTLVPLLLMAICFCSCAPSLYFPDKVVSPGFAEKGEGKIWLTAKPQLNGADSGGKSGSPFSASVGAAYAFSENLGAYLHYSNLANRTTQELHEGPTLAQTSRTGGNFNGDKIEAALVYFTPAGSTQHFELSGGYSRGTVNRSSRLSDSNNFSTRYFTVFLQPAWTVQERGVTFSCGAKVFLQQFDQFSGSAFTRQLFTDNRQFLTEQLLYGAQPFINIDAGSRYIRFSIQGSMPLLVRPQLYSVPLAGFPLHICAGICLQLNKRLIDDFKSNHNNEHQQ
jgi:hypothetical protein